VQADLKRELVAFWKSKSMVEIQIAEAQSSMGAYAMKNATEAANFFGRPGALKFRDFAWWFDVRVLNGSMKGLALKDADPATFGVWLKSCSECPDSWGYEANSLRRAGKLWAKRFMEFDAEQKRLFVLGCLRANLSRQEFKATVILRRGIIALGFGVNEGLEKTLKLEN